MKGFDPRFTNLPDYILKCTAQIWEGRDIAALDWHYGDDQAGFLSSHRIVSTATHSGGSFGPATGRKVTSRTIADTFCHENRVWDEWLIRDNGAIATELGQTAKTAAQALIDNIAIWKQILFQTRDRE